MFGDPCPSCRSLQRGTALRCWKCGLGLTQAFDPAAAAASAAASAATSASAIPDVAGDDALGGSPHLGPCPVGFLDRMFSPRLTQAELDRAARGFKSVPFYESYHTLAALEIGLGALLPYVALWILSALPGAPTGVRFIPRPGLTMTWLTLLVLALAYGVSIGEAMAAAVGGLLVGACGFVVLFASLGVRPFSVPLTLAIGVLLYLQMILFYKAFRTSLARRHYQLGARVGRL